MPPEIVERIAAETKIPQLFTVLSEDLSSSDLQSLLIAVYQARAAALRDRDLPPGAKRPLLAPSSVDARIFNLFDRVAFEVAEGFEALELSPVGPLGLSRVLGGIDQNNVLTTIRNAEVLGDATPAMALECCRRRRDSSRNGDPTPVRLASSHRAIRLQPFDVPGYVPHFRLFCLVSAGRDSGSNAFEIQHLGEHIRFYLRLFRALGAHGFRLGNPLVEITDPEITKTLLDARGIPREELRESIRAHRLGESERFLADRGITLPHAIGDPAGELQDVAVQHKLERRVDRLALLKADVLDVLQGEFPEAQFRFNLARLEGLGYYTGLCLRISPEAPDGVRYPIVDGGFTDWTARLLQNRKERLLTTGIGSEFACTRYRAT